MLMVRMYCVYDPITICKKQLRGRDVIYDDWTKGRTAAGVTRRL